MDPACEARTRLSIGLHRISWVLVKIFEGNEGVFVARMELHAFCAAAA